MSCINVFSSVMHNSEFTVGRQNEGAHTQLFNLLAPAWNTIRQSSAPLGTAKYFIKDMIFPDGGAIYFRSTNLMIFFRNTSFSSGFKGG
jgi:hypothetical protein